MKQLIIAIATGIIAATAIGAPQAEAGGRFGFHFSPAFIPTPTYQGRSYRRRNWDREDRYERRQRRLRALRRLKIERRAAAARRHRLEAARRKAAQAKHQAAIRAAKHRAAQQKLAAAAAATEVTKTPAASPPPLPAKKATVIATGPVPTEALLITQETKPAAKATPAETKKPTPPAKLSCKQFLPGPGITISVPCAK